MKTWKWNNAKTNPPKHNKDVLVSNGGSYCIAWFDDTDKEWVDSTKTVDSCLSLYICLNNVIWWTEIIGPKEEI